MKKIINSEFIKSTSKWILIVVTFLNGPEILSQWIQEGNSINGIAEMDQLSRNSLNSEGNIIAIGSSVNDSAGNNAGYVRVLELVGQQWVQKGNYLFGEQDELFGTVVSLNGEGNILAVGGHRNSDVYSYNGAVKIFEWNNPTSDWVQKGSTIYGDSTSTFFGNDLELSEDGLTIIVGAYGFDGVGQNSGQAKVYMFDGNDWVQKGQTFNGERADDELGSAVDISKNGQVIGIGSPSYDGASGTEFSLGKIDFYQWNDSIWEIMGSSILGKEAGDRAGDNFEINYTGTKIIVGTLQNDDYFYNNGLVRVFNWDSLSWNQQGSLLYGTEDYESFGKSVEIDSSGNMILIANSHNDSVGNTVGGAISMVWDGTDWIEYGGWLYGENNGDSFGKRISMSYSGSKISIGASGYDVNGLNTNGQVKVYKMSSVSVKESYNTSNLKIFPTATNDYIQVQSGNLNISSIKVFNLNGKLVFEKRLDQMVYKLDCSNYESGLYLMKVETNKEVSSYKIIKN